MKRILVPAVLAAWAILLLLPLVLHPENGPMPRVDQRTDFTDTHLSLARYIHDSIEQYGRLPLWNENRFSGQPLAADPLAGFWYIPNWLTFWQPEPWMFTLLFLLHLCWTGLGMIALLEAEGVSRAGGLLAALAWMGTPRLIGTLGSGQVSIIFSLAWTPWLLLAFRKAAQDPSLRRAALAAAYLAVTFLADVRWGFYGGIFAACYALTHFSFSRSNLRRAALPLLAAVLLAALLTAGLTIPMMEFMGLSRRAAMTGGDTGAFSIQPYNLLGLIIPPYGMIYELVIYLGWLPLLLAVMGAARQKWFWLGAVLAAAVYALGNEGFLYPLLLRILPGVSWLRVPSRVWFIVALSAAALAGWGTDGLLTSLKNACFKGRALILLTGLLLSLTAVNLMWYNVSQLKSVPLPASPAADWLAAQPGLFRVYSPDGSLPAQAPLQQANGIDPLHLASYAAFLGKASGMDLPGYSVSVPNIYIDSYTPPGIIQAASRPDTVRLGLLNVKYLVAGFPLQSARLALVKQFGSLLIYQNLDYRPRAWLENGQVTITSWSAERIVLTSDGPAGFLVLSEINYPGWKAEVDGAAAPFTATDGLLRSIALPAGRHTVTWKFHPFNVFLGAGISSAGWIILGGLIIYQTIRRKKFRLQKAGRATTDHTTT